MVPFYYRVTSILKPLQVVRVVLFTKGEMKFQNRTVLSIVGTRRHTPHGERFCKKLIQSIANYHPIICSGLARGIDIITHREALKAGLDSVACLAHGLDHVYPSEHKEDAIAIQKQGVLVTDFLPRTPFKRGYFSRRNRLIAGMAVATVVIESGISGGSMNTGHLAHLYGREIFAVPARTDIKSAGCHELIVQQKAQLLSDPEHLHKK